MQNADRRRRRRRVVVINDDPAILAVYRDVLEELRHDPVPMAIEAVGVEQIRAAAPDAVILDIEVGGQAQQGIELIERLRQDTELAAVPIVVGTASAAALDGARARLARMRVPMLLKPIDLEQLEQLLESGADGRGDA